MKAVLLTAHGGTEKLSFGEVKTPKPGAGDVLVRVHAASVNHLDLWTRMGLPGVTIPMPHILGCDAAGEVAEIGSGVTGLRLGERVAVLPGVSCGECAHCRDGWDSACRVYKIIGFLRPGGYAEYVSVPARNVIPVSPRLTMEEWAAIPLVFLTAWHMLVRHGRLASGETVLVHGASSGVGSAAVQIAKHFGATVIATVGSKEKSAAAAALGADHVILYKEVPVAQTALEMTGGCGVDLVIEHIGQATWEESLKALTKRGRLVTCGATSGGDVKINLRYLYMNQIQMTGSYMGGKPELLEIVKLVEAGKLKPVIDRVFPLKEAAAAHARMESRAHFGKIILKP